MRCSRLLRRHSRTAHDGTHGVWCAVTQPPWPRLTSSEHETLSPSSRSHRILQQTPAGRCGHKTLAAHRKGDSAQRRRYGSLCSSAHGAHAGHAPTLIKRHACRAKARRVVRRRRRSPCYSLSFKRISHGPFDAVRGFRAGEPNPLTRDNEEKTVTLGTILLIVLVLMLIGAIPTWSHSRSWGYGPSGGLGLVLVVVVVLLLMGRL